MDKAIFAVLIIVTIILVGSMVFLTQKIDTLSAEVENLKNNDSKAVNVEDAAIDNTNNTNKISKTSKSDGKEKKVKVEFDPEKLKTTVEDCEYSLLKEDEYDLSPLGLKTKIEDGKVYVSVKFVEDYTADLYGIDKEFVDKEITGFKSEPVMCYTAIAGNGIDAPVLCFLMDDGTVEMLDTKTAFKKDECVSGGKIKGLENIVSFELVNVHENEGGGYVSTVAIDEDGYAYDIFELIDR